MPVVFLTRERSSLWMRIAQAEEVCVNFFLLVTLETRLSDMHI